VNSGDSSNQVLRAGLIGAGWIAGSHAEVLASRPDVRVAAICDTDRSRAAALAASTAAAASTAGAGSAAAAVYTDWQAMLDQEALDAVWVCIPPRAHAAPVLSPAARRLPVYLEKPVARTLEDARTITDAVQSSGIVCAVGYQWHATGVLDDLHAALAGRQLGCLTAQSVGGTQSRPWFLDRAAGGGNLLERGSHHIDLARAIAGEVTAVQAAASAIRMAPRPDGATGPGGVDDIDDAVTLLLTFATGATGTITVAWTADTVPGSYWVEAVAADARLHIDLAGLPSLSGAAGGEPVTASSGEDPFARSIGRFLDAVREGRPDRVFCTPADALRTLAVAVAAEQSLADGGRIPVAAG
jgi:myo-inositol 2-dehydrogenase / D-chiro-inositol 1-dehydrogenase